MVSSTLNKKIQVMITFGYHKKGSKTLLTSTALSSMIRKRYDNVSVLFVIIFYLIGWRTNWFTEVFSPKVKVELVEGGTFWLFKSPSLPGSMSWGSEVLCIATWAISL